MNWWGAGFLIIAGSLGIVAGARLAKAVGEWLAGPADMHDLWDMSESDLP